MLEWVLGCFFKNSNRKVHVTQQTLDLLDGEYFYEPGTKTAKNDPLLVNNDIETFLISPQYYGDVNVRRLCAQSTRQTLICIFYSRSSIIRPMR